MMNALSALAVRGTPVQRGTIGIYYLPLPRLANTVRNPPLRPAKGNNLISTLQFQLCAGRRGLVGGRPPCRVGVAQGQNKNPHLGILISGGPGRTRTDTHC